jgi:hypothetical protein
MMVRRREFLADRFASAQAMDRAGSAGVLEQLLDSAGLASAPPHGFRGSSRWHPSIAERLRAIRERSVSAIPIGIAALLAFFVLASTRFVLGKTPNTQIGERTVFEALTGLFVFLFGYVVHCMIVQTNERARVLDPELRRRAIALLVWSALFSFVLAIGIYVASGVSGDSSGVDAPLRIETVEQMLLAASIPACVLSFVVAFAILYRLTGEPVDGLQSHIAVSFFGSLLAYGLLWIASQGVSPILEAYRNDQVEKFARNLTTDRRLIGGLADDDATTRLRENIEAEGLRLERIALLKSLLERHEFSPPLSFLLLWQGPFRGTIL